MHYRQLGHSGLLVSEIILATKGRSPVDNNPNNAGSSRYLESGNIAHFTQHG